MLFFKRVEVGGQRWGTVLEELKFMKFLENPRPLLTRYEYSASKEIVSSDQVTKYLKKGGRRFSF